MENNKRLIDANALLEKMEYTSTDVCADYGDGFCQHGYSTPLLRLMVSETPTVDAVEVVYARWRWGYNSMNQYGAWCAECECGWEDKGTGDDFIRVQGLVIAHKYCPNCGAKMDGN